MSIPWGTVKLQFAKYFEVLSTVIESFLSMSISLLLSIFFNKEALKKKLQRFQKTVGNKPSAAKFQGGENILSEWCSIVCCNK